MEMRLLIVDSDSTLRSELWNLLSLYRIFHLEAERSITEQTIDYVQIHNVDVIFVKVCPGNAQMGSDGFYLAAILGKTHPDIQITTYSNSKDRYLDLNVSITSNFFHCQ